MKVGRTQSYSEDLNVQQVYANHNRLIEYSFFIASALICWGGGACRMDTNRVNVLNGAESTMLFKEIV